MITAAMWWPDIPQDEMPYASQIPQGLATPSNRQE